MFLFVIISLVALFLLSNRDRVPDWIPDKYLHLAKTEKEDPSVRELLKPLYDIVPPTSHAYIDKAKKKLEKFKEQALTEGTQVTDMMETKGKAVEYLNRTTFFLPNDLDREMKIRGYISHVDKMLQGYMYHLYGAPFDDFGYSSIQDTWA